MRCSAADTHLKVRDREVSGVHFLTWGVFDCHIALRRFVAVLFMPYKIGCNPMQPLYGALPVPYVPVRVTRDALVAHRYTYAPPRCRNSLYRRTFIHLLVFVRNDLADPVFHGVELAGLLSYLLSMLSYLPILLDPFLSSVFSFFLSRLVLCGWGL